MLSQKLHLKTASRFIVLNAPSGFERALEPLPAGARQERSLRGTFDLILLFVLNTKELNSQWPKVIRALNENAALWVAYPKKSSGITSDLASMNRGWDITRGSPWQPVASISIDDSWTSVRFKYAPGLEEQRAQRGEE